MTREDFSTWKIPYLEEFLASRGINRTGTKEMLVRNCFSAYELELQETITDLLQEQNEVMKNHLDKLVIGKISLPDPYSLVDEWCNAPSHLPDTLYNDDVNDIDINVRYCFVRGNCCHEQRILNANYDVWVWLDKDSGDIINTGCTCVAG